jgi:hypothetical protein
MEDESMPRGQAPERGRFEVREHMAGGVLAVYWVERPGATGLLVNGLTFGTTERLAALGRAITLYLSGPGEYDRGHQAAILELAVMTPEDRANVLSRARHPSTRLAAVPDQEAGT